MLQAATGVGSIYLDCKSKKPETTDVHLISCVRETLVHTCKTCGATFDEKEQLAGHSSGHVRRGEQQKRSDAKNAYPRKCSECEFVAESAAKYGGHKRVHVIPFESLKCDDARKNRLLFELGHQCERCKLSEWLDQKIPIEIDHIDGNPDNNVRSNLRLLCPNCHAQQPTHAGANARKHTGTKRQEVMSRYPSYRHHTIIGSVV